jgi:hypothetical protein
MEPIAPAPYINVFIEPPPLRIELIDSANLAFALSPIVYD